MKKIIAYLLIALMCVSCLAGCGDKNEVSEDLQAAADYVYAMYKNAGKVTATDYERTTQVMIDNVAYTVEWTADNDAVKITVKDKIATIDVDEKTEKEINYVLTATIKDADGNYVTKEFKYTIPAYEGLEKIVENAYALEPGETMDGTYTLEGVILSVDTAYDSAYDNVTVTIQVGDLKDKPIICYRMKNGEGVTAIDTIKVGDTITVTGELTNYSGKIEFTAGCTLDKVVVGEASEVEVPTIPADATMEDIVDIAYTLTVGQALADTQTLTGVITSVDTAYDASYGNVTVTIQVGNKSDKLIKCFRMKGTGADTIAVGDTITVTGTLKNFQGEVEYDAGCTLDSYTSAGGSNSNTNGNGNSNGNNNSNGNSNSNSNGNSNSNSNGNSNGNTSGGSASSVTPSSSAAEIMNAAYALGANEKLNGTYTLSGIITKVNEAYNATYSNATVTIKVDGSDKEIRCFHMGGTGADQVGTGDWVKVSGTIVNYVGDLGYSTIEFESGCTLVSYTINTTKVTYQTPAEIVAAASKLESNAYLEGGPYTLTGKITSFKFTYNPEYTTIAVYINVEGTEILCYKLSGTGIDTVKEGDTITVTGQLMKYYETIEFNGCTLDKVN